MEHSASAVIAQDPLGRVILPRLPVFRTQHAYDPDNGLGHQIDRGNAEALSSARPLIPARHTGRRGRQ